ncbi:hypothetical protein QNK09_00295 [Brevibacillus agri]|uniref:hypothetical protein n=1 Tax=Brevibacillus agri TaxID=51101 RepID=UPI0024C045CC|nr:hypothetical protein [Brevibacillus agri]WHX30765.1 hypothetical protein QNK09_00295 [Brevibacillus agri]
MSIFNKRTLSLILSICLLVIVLGNNVLAKDHKYSNDSDDFEIIQNDYKAIVLKGEYEGDELYATFDKVTHEITMKAVTNASVMGMQLFSAKPKETEYKVDLKEYHDGELSAVITNEDGEVEYEIDTTKVSAQAPLVVPLLEILGSALLEELLAIAAAITIGGITYVVVTEMADTIRKKSYNYYYAKVKYGDVYIGPAFPNDSAAFAYLNESAKNDVWAKTKDKATQAAMKVAGYAQYCTSNDYKGDGYYPHYHPKTRSGDKIDNHIFYSN